MPAPAMSRAGWVPHALSIPRRAGARVLRVCHVRRVPRARPSLTGAPCPGPCPALPLPAPRARGTSPGEAELFLTAASA